MDIERTSVMEDFEVIEIFDDSNPYPSLFGIYWANDMNGVMNMKKWKIIFEKSLRVIIPLDPVEGSRYMEPVHNYESDDDLDYIYKITERVMNQLKKR